MIGSKVVPWVVIMACAIGLSFLIFGSDATRLDLSSDMSYREKKESIERLFVDRTAQEAHRVFSEGIQQLPLTETHELAHIFGETLYAHEGLDGFAICGSEFGFGCAHSFIGRVIADRGANVSHALDVACIEEGGTLALGCFHGLGHGILTYYGYSPEALQRSLALCDTLSWHQEYGGCRDGVFMEYNFRTMEGRDGAGNRPLNPSEPYSPCATLPVSYRTSCYFGQPGWWRQSFVGDGNATKRIGELCAQLQNIDEKRACFRGMGYTEAPQLVFDAEKGSVFCDAFEMISADARLWCREGVAWALYATGDTQGAKEVCTKGLVSDNTEKCLKEYLFVIQH